MTSKKDKQYAFRDFSRKGNYFDPLNFEAWIARHQIILLVDELNSLEELAAKNLDAAGSFGDYIKEHFLTPSNRYFIFTSHVVTDVTSFSHYVDKWATSGSGRDVIL
jgi:hypothetical protein